MLVLWFVPGKIRSELSTISHSYLREVELVVYAPKYKTFKKSTIWVKDEPFLRIKDEKEILLYNHYIDVTILKQNEHLYNVNFKKTFHFAQLVNTDGTRRKWLETKIKPGIKVAHKILSSKWLICKLTVILSQRWWCP